MAVKSKKESFKEKVNTNGIRSKFKYSNTHRIKNIKAVKKSRNIKYVSKRLKIKHVRQRKAVNRRSESQDNNRIRTQRLIGNISSNAKDTLKGNDNYNQPDTGIQAVLYASDEIDTAMDMIYSSKRVMRAVKATRTIITTSKEKGRIDKRILAKQLSIKGIKSGIKTARNINTRISSQFQSEDTDLGIKSFAEAEKEVKKTYDTLSAIKNTSSDISNIVNNVRNMNAKSNEYIRDKIYTDKIKRYGSHKENIQGSKFNRKGSTNYSQKKSLYRPKKIKTNRVTIKSIIPNNKMASFSKKTIEVVKNATFIILPGKKELLFLLLCVICVVVMLGSLSSGMVSALSQQYFMADDDIAKKYQEKVELLDDDLKEEIKELRDDDSYDSSKVVYIGDKQGIYTNFQEIFAVAAVEFKQDLSFSNREEEFIEEIYEKMYDIRISSETYYVVDRNGDEVSRIRKIITIYTNDMESIMSELRFDNDQSSWARRLVSSFSEQFPNFAQQYGELTQEELRELIENAPKLSNAKQQKLYDTALSIVGRVKYFWGGKSSAGRNEEWGELVEVTAKGSDTTGIYKPFGLDCSGYVDWVYKTAGIGNMLSGGGTAYQFTKSYPIRNDELQVGDLAFLQMPDSSGINHVGIYIGKDIDDNNLYAHCEWGTGVTVNGFNGFKYFRRVVNFE